MTVEPGIDVLTEDEADEFVAAVREGHDEGPRPPLLLGVRIIHTPYVAEVNLGFLAGRCFHPNCYFRSAEGKLLPEIALDRGVAYLDTVDFL